MTRREVFEKVKAHLLQQGVRAESPVDASCAYRGADGTMCAVGCLISDVAYGRHLEGLSADAVPVRHALRDSGVADDGFGGLTRMLLAMQNLHDNVATADWPAGLDAVEEHFLSGEP